MVALVVFFLLNGYYNSSIYTCILDARNAGCRHMTFTVEDRTYFSIQTAFFSQQRRSPRNRRRACLINLTQLTSLVLQFEIDFIGSYSRKKIPSWHEADVSAWPASQLWDCRYRRESLRGNPHSRASLQAGRQTEVPVYLMAAQGENPEQGPGSGGFTW